MKQLTIILSLLLLTACSTMQPPRYAISVDNVQKLKTMKEVSGEFVAFNQSSKFSSNWLQF